MQNLIRSALLAIVVAGMCSATAPAVEDFAALQPDQQIADFRTEVLYETGAGVPLGARFRHVPTGFVLDVLRIQSVPQAFMWVNSFPPSDQGEPHTCEHLLLGKGTKGRYVASLEDMSLGSSSAFTMQLQTCYHYHTAAGADVFFDLMEAKLDAMLSPNFTDEEIRREVCNIGYSIDPTDSLLRLEEKGTVYNEMVSSFERPWANLGVALDLMLFGAGHPLANSSGGIPDAIRTMTPQDLRRFHRESYRLGNMGMIVSIPGDIDLEECLVRTSDILKTVQPEAELGADPTRVEDDMPPPQSAPAGQKRISYFPHQNPSEPGLLVYAWPPTLELSNNELYVLDLLLDNLAGGETSDLYRLFIDSRTRQLDLGANSVFGWVSSDRGHATYVGFNNVKREATDAAMIDSVRALITARLQEIADWPAGSDELAAFNERAQNRILEGRRSLRKFLNSPPGFGFRGTGSRWYFHLKHLQNTDGFRKQLELDAEFAFAEQAIKSGRNFWGEYLQAWGMLATVPYAAAAQPKPELIALGEAARAERIESFKSELKQQYHARDEQQAAEQYKADYDRATDVIKAEARTIPMPQFVADPPLSLDDQLQYRVDTYAGDVPVVVSTFDNISSGTAGLAFRLDVVPESQLLYVPALPTLLTDVGVITDGEPVPYDRMKEMIRREILYLRAYFTTNFRTQRAELVLKAAGSDRPEAQRALEWLSLALFSADWRPENLDRIRDAIDLELKSRRNTMRWAEEAWVQDPANAYWRQNNPLLMTANCFLTQTHALHRLRWRLKQAANADAQLDVGRFLNELAAAGQDLDRAGLTSLLARLSDAEADVTAPSVANALSETLKQQSEPTRALCLEAVGDLKLSLSDLPDASLHADWNYLCNQMRDDLAVAPEAALADLEDVLERLRQVKATRGFMIAGRETQTVMRPDLERITKRLGTGPISPQVYDDRPVVLTRLRARTGQTDRPLYVGLVNENTRSGVFVNTTACASYEDTDPETLLKFLSARLYGGGGAHSMFMKTWGAGLAYSNGLRSNESTGRLIYYAERCPDLAQTMQFVVGELKNAPYDTTLAEYAVAQAFSVFRSGRRYEERGEAMAADLTDGLTPDVVERFRKGILGLRDRENLYGELQARMEPTYGEVLPGYGPTAAESPDAVNFVIGPEAQFESFEAYLRGVEDSEIKVERLYPRDFWLVPGE